MERIRRNRITRRAIKALVVGVFLLGIGLNWPRERLLMEVSHPIVKVDADKTQVLWLSSDRVLLVTTEQEGAEDDMGNGPPIKTHWQGSADILDIHTGVRTRLTGLTSLLNHVTVFPRTAPTNLQLSPGGTWLLWRAEDNFSCSQAAYLDGTHYRELQTTHYGNRNFFLDDRHLMQVPRSEPPMIVRDLLAPTQDRKYWKLEQMKTVLTQYTLQHPTALRVYALPRNRTQDDAEIHQYRMQDQIAMELNMSNHAFRMPWSLWEKVVKLPAGGKLTSVDESVSPRQDAIFYDLYVLRLPPLMAMLKRFFPKLNGTPVITEGIWVSLGDGQKLRELGHVPRGHRNASGEYDDYLSDVQWLPDGKRISFLYRGVLYVVSAETEK